MHGSSLYDHGHSSLSLARFKINRTNIRSIQMEWWLNLLIKHEEVEQQIKRTLNTRIENMKLKNRSCIED